MNGNSFANLIMNLRCIAAGLLLITADLFGQHKVPPLFSEQKPIVARLSYSIGKVKKSTSDTVYFSSRLSYQNDKGGWDSLSVKIRGRGNFRRKTCFFTPLRLKMKKSDSRKTLFAGNKSLKLVLPCSNGESGRVLIMKEYLCYQIYRTITPYSFNVRLAELSLTNVRAKRSKTYPLLAFFIEDDDLMAKRLNGKVVDSVNLHPLQLFDSLALRQDFFQFLVANTDWSSTYFHNMKIIEIPPGRFVPVAYDFDMSGLVDAPYATVNQSLQLSSVRERLYRGFCRNASITQAIRKEYLDKETKVFEVINSFENSFEPREFNGIKKYVQEFFEIMKDDGKFKTNITENCRTK